MTSSYRRALTWILLATLVAAAAILSGVFWTVFFGATVAYVLLPLQKRLQDRGVPATVAAIFATGSSLLLLCLVVGLTGFLLYRRHSLVIEFIRTLPETIEISVFGFVYPLETEAAMQTAFSTVTDFALQMVSTMPAMALKFTVFPFVVFGLLVGHESVKEAVMTAIPPAYRDIIESFGARIQNTLFAIYVLQVATGVATFLISVPVFLLLGYDIFLSLAFFAGVLQFLPIVGPSILVAGLAVYQVTIGQVTAAILVLVVGAVLIAWIPDVLVRPQLARRTGQLSGSLYFVGFVGGLLTVGAIGVVAGPLVVALVVEAVSQLEAASV